MKSPLPLRAAVNFAKFTILFQVIKSSLFFEAWQIIARLTMKVFNRWILFLFLSIKIFSQILLFLKAKNYALCKFKNYKIYFNTS